MSQQRDVHHHWRVVLVGQPVSGKRTLAQGLLTAAGATRRAAAIAQFGDGGTHKADKTTSLAEESVRRLQMHGTGLSHAFIGGTAASTSGGDTPATAAPSMEVFVVDHPSGLHVALPSVDTLRMCLILFVVDLAMPETAEEQLLSWRHHVHHHVASMCTSSTSLQELINTSKALIDQQRASIETSPAGTVIESLRSEFSALTGTSPGSGAVPFAPAADICPVRGLVVANKLDVLEKRFLAGGSKSSVYDTKLSRVQFLLHLLRLAAIRQCSGFVQLSSTYTPASTFKALLSYIEQDFGSRDLSAGATASQREESSAPTDSEEVRNKAGTVRREVLAALNSTAPTSSMRVLPAGWDSETYIHPFVRTNSLDAKSSLFHAHEEKAADGTTDITSHDQLLSEMEMTMEETPVWDMV
jgi:hypothetical protein